MLAVGDSPFAVVDAGVADVTSVHKHTSLYCTRSRSRQIKTS